MENTETTRIIEVNGVKLQVDLRQAKRIDELRVGSRVKVLKREYGDEHKVYHGIVIGFEPFKKLPTIIVACAKIEYGEAKVSFVYYNTSSKDVEIVAAIDDDVAAIDKQAFVDTCNREIQKKKAEIQEIEERKTYFLKKFGVYWREVEEAVVDATSE